MRNVYEKVREFNSGLIPEMVDGKFHLMSRDFYRFFRGSCHLYYENLHQEKLPPSPLTWICGDLHIENFGSYKGDNRQVYFDLNDFDEAVLAPASWELVRFISCIFIAFETLQIGNKKALNMARMFLKKYSETLVTGKSHYIETQTAKGIVKTFLNTVSKRGQDRLLEKRTVIKASKVRLKLNKKQLELDKDLRRDLKEHLNDWIMNNSSSPYNLVVTDIAYRRAGLGSLGLKRYLALMKSTNEHEKYMVLDMKQSRASSLSPFLKVSQPSWENEAERIIAIQHRMQNMAPALLSTTIFRNEPFVLQELQSTKDRLNFELIKHDYRNIYQAINDMAVLTASSQLRSSGRQGSAIADALINFGTVRDWHEKLIKVAAEQSRRVREDYSEFSAHCKKTTTFSAPKNKISSSPLMLYIA